MATLNQPAPLTEYLIDEEERLFALLAPVCGWENAQKLVEERIERMAEELAYSI